jgi:hypothetical protein
MQPQIVRTVLAGTDYDFADQPAGANPPAIQVEVLPVNNRTGNASFTITYSDGTSTDHNNIQSTQAPQTYPGTPGSSIAEVENRGPASIRLRW